MHDLLPFIIIFFFLAAFLRIDFFFYLLYFLFGVYFLAGLWIDRALSGLRVEHRFEQRAFLGERVTVAITLHNRSLLPVPWLRLHESLPVQLKAPSFFRGIVSLLPRETRTLSYDLEARRRGYYPLGPLSLHSGDLLGVRTHVRRVNDVGALLVYPRIIPLTRFGLAAQTPLGDVPSSRHLYEDPTRMIGVRPYQSGDSLRYIHWKTSAATGVLQVKRFEPAISLEAQILLNMNREEYGRTRYYTASEMGIVAAASIAHYLSEKRQKVGLSTNGLDPLAGEDASAMLEVEPRKGRDHLMRILDALARVQLSEGRPFVEVVRQARLRLSWGGTAVILTGDADDTLFETMLWLKRSGFHVLLTVLDPQSPFQEIKARARSVGIAAHEVWDEGDLDVWR